MQYQCDNLYLALQERAKNRTRRQLAIDLGLPEKKHALITKILNGVRVSRASEIEIARALGIAPPPRNPPRITVPRRLAPLYEQAREQGRSTEDILLRGLQEG